MKIKTWLVLTGLALLLLPSLLSGAKYAGEIFYLSPGVANQAMGNTGLTNDDNLSAAWWNPALLTDATRQGAELMHSEQFQGLMQFNQLAAIIGRQSKLGLVITHIGISDVALTRLAHPGDTLSADNQPYVWKRVNNNDLMAYVGFSRALSDNFSLGVTPKLAYRSMAEKSGYGFGADFGLLWKLKPQLRLGMVARNVFTTQLVWQNGTWETALPSVDAELGWQTKLAQGKIPVRAVFGMETMLEGRAEAATINAGAFSADFHAGLSVQPILPVKVMAGYDVNAFTTGLGIQISNLSLEYAIKLGSKDDLGYSQRVSAGWRW